MQTAFEGYFCPEELNQETWVRSPFLIDFEKIDDKDLVKDDLIDLRSTEVLRAEFDAKNLADFWCHLAPAYSRLSQRTMSVLIPFPTTYLCEAGFSTLVSIKTKNQNRLEVKDDMRLALSKTAPQFDVIMKNKQQQMSH